MAQEPRGNPQVTARVERAIVDRLDRIAEAMGEGQIPGAPKAKQTDAVRAVLLAGIPILEERLGLTGKPKG